MRETNPVGSVSTAEQLLELQAEPFRQGVEEGLRRMTETAKDFIALAALRLPDSSPDLGLFDSIKELDREFNYKCPCVFRDGACKRCGKADIFYRIPTTPGPFGTEGP